MEIFLLLWQWVGKKRKERKEGKVREAQQEKQANENKKQKKRDRSFCWLFGIFDKVGVEGMEGGSDSNGVGRRAKERVARMEPMKSADG